ncbi:hypothetical protein MesoLjLc_04330 [Mesorhizobium sp. L-8-10]|nr:hypothetical protein MesoLjLc_04330 [Mesorhizobium sp. L-8-10]
MAASFSENSPLIDTVAIDVFMAEASRGRPYRGTTGLPVRCASDVPTPDTLRPKGPRTAEPCIGCGRLWSRKPDNCKYQDGWVE